MQNKTQSVNLPYLRLVSTICYGWLLPVILLLAALPARADVKLPAIFGDHMVLQQGVTLPVWGWADSGEKITVTFGNKKAETTANAEGKWRVDLPALPAGTPVGTLVVAGKNTVTINDVLVGDVWLCSGQSNMEYPLVNAIGGNEAMTQAGDPQLRIFRVNHQIALAPRDDVQGSWQLCTPAAVRTFSAVGYFFGEYLRSELHRPIGLIESAYGGTPAQAWTDLPTLKANPALVHYADEFEKIAARFPGGDREFAAKTAAYDEAAKAMQRGARTNVVYQASMSQWREDVAQAKAAGQPVPREPRVPQPRSLGVQKVTPTVLFNGKIAPLMPFSIKGCIWYQGENNTHNTAESVGYATLFPAMITDWRTLWHQGDFPFLFVQLPNYLGSGEDWPHLRESQLKTLFLPKSGMAVTIDIGTGGNIHPPQKAVVAYRLSLLARHIAYGENLVCNGPLYEGMKIEGNRIQINFERDSIGGGLIIGTTPWEDPKAKVTASKTELQGFFIAGENRKWIDAEAKIDGNSVVVSSPEVPHPVAVRYAWAQDPVCNLYNQEKLPASPFRTDDWQETMPPASATK